MNFGNAGAVLTHELLHALLNVDDTTLYTDFASYGIVNPGDGSTAAISTWIQNGCPSTK